MSTSGSSPGGGTCDADDLCTGSSADCPPRYLAGVECRGSRGACDAAEVCTGGSAECPPDSLESAGMVCRASSDTACDPAEACDGVSSACPSDVTMCGAVDAGVTDDAGMVAADAGTVPMDDAGMVAMDDAGGRDAGARRDAGRADDGGGGGLDAGLPPPVAAEGCSCRAAGRGQDGSGGTLGVLATLGALLSRSRRRARAQKHKHL